MGEMPEIAFESSQGDVADGKPNQRLIHGSAWWSAACPASSTQMPETFVQPKWLRAVDGSRNWCPPDCVGFVGSFLNLPWCSDKPAARKMVPKMDLFHAVKQGYNGFWFQARY